MASLDLSVCINIQSPYIDGYVYVKESLTAGIIDKWEMKLTVGDAELAYKHLYTEKVPAYIFQFIVFVNIIVEHG